MSTLFTTTTVQNDIAIDEVRSVCSTTKSGTSERYSPLLKEKKVQLTAKSAVRGKWTEDEHTKFLQAIRLYGKDWRKMETFIGTRNVK